ncbi:Ig-like domain-containing protein [Hyalangium minutum]|uniref:Big-1 domain-containing protein n=1 Tax=Hyalangium minutum TaxID=394096 RepID=A0A085WLY4_9BACT|nr:Ig-like domain-containing protein [Hyalangium minutum]KFE68697.1 hypothetical protein DB31_7934 [Hyalangium minutum]
MASRPLSLGWCFTLAVLIVGAAGCGGSDPQPPLPTPDLPDAALSKVEVSRTANVLADGRDIVTLTVTVVKADGTALSGRTVRLEVSGEGNMLAPASGQTNPQGVLTATLASTRPGTKKVKASVDAEGGPVVLSAQPTVEFISPGNPATRLEFTVPPGDVIAGTPFSVTATAYDASNNVATGFTGTVQLTSSDPQAVLPGAFTFGASNAGTASLSVELRTAGTQTLSLAHGLSGSPLTASKTVVAASPARLAFSGQPANGTVRTTLAAVRVQVTDAYGNATPASSPQVSVSLSGGDAAATLSGTRNVDPVSGEATFSDLSVDQEGNGFQLVATSGTLTQGTSSTFTITDNLAPAAAVIAVTVLTPSTVRVTWTTVGDDGNLGQAATQELRYATTPITNLDQFNAGLVAVAPSPQEPGSAESTLVMGLTLNVDHYFALKVTDGAGNYSLSNSPKVGGGDPCGGVTCTPPAGTCSADGRTAIGYTSACVVENGAGVCRDTPAQTACQSYETCGAGSCGPVTAGSQAGSIVISEFSALGSEFIELHNTTAADIDVHGYTFRNAAGVEVDLRAPSDPNGTAGTAVVVTAGGRLYGIANPSGSIPGGVGFVYGAPGTSFSLADTGDALALYAAPPAGNLQDVVDFRAFKSDPNTPLAASDFVGFAGSSTQLDPESLSAAGNDTATNWCVSFYGSGVRGSRVTNTAGAANGSCKVAVINEVYLDAPSTDNGLVFIELAGPGGSVIGGAKIADVEGRAGTTAAGANNESFSPYTIPAGTRFPADGILLIADLNPSGQTLVPNFVAGVDVGANNVDLENFGGDSVQLINAAGTALLDVLGQDVSGTTLDTNTADNGFAMYEGTIAVYVSTTGSWSSSLARSPGSADTDNNRNDFRTDPSPTPGLPNDLANFTVTSLFPDDGPATAGANGIVVTGTDLAPTMRAQFGGSSSVLCSVSTPTTASCTAVTNAGAVGVVDVTFTPAASVGASGPFILSRGFTYTGNENETNSVLEADFCNLQSPTTLSVVRSTVTPVIYGRIYETGITEPPGPPAGILAEVGYGNNGSDPRSNNSWKFFPATYNVQVGNDDEFMGSFTAPATAATYAYTYRFSQDNGLKWTYCDKDGAGSNTNPDLVFSPTQLGVMTVTNN